MAQNQVAEKETAKKPPITDQVMSRVMDLEKSQGFMLPKGYSASNALNKALIDLQTTPSTVKGVDGTMMSTSDPRSVAQALFDMVIQGLSPNQTQVYFIQRRNYKDNTIKLELQRSYFGTQMVLKRLPEIEDIQAFVVHDGDELQTDFDIGSMRDKVVSFKHNWENQDNDIKAALAIIYKSNGEHEITVMTKKEIDIAWQAAKTKNVIDKFPGEMAKRTVINRAAKNIINTSNGNQELLASISNTSENEYDNDQERRDVTPEHKTQDLVDFLNEDDQNKPVAPNDETAEPQTPAKPQPKDPFADFDKKQGIKAKEANSDGDERTNEADGQTDIFDAPNSEADQG